MRQIPILLALLAFPCGQTRAADDPLLALPVPMFTVVMTPRAPVIDGKFAASEWRYAAGTAGFLNLADGNLADEKTAVQVTFDGQKLYLAFQCLFPSERAARATELRRDGGVYSDDSIEVYLLPPGADEKQFY